MVSNLRLFILTPMKILQPLHSELKKIFKSLEKRR